MLDNSFNAKLCDFGLLTQVSHTKTSRTTEHICGTPVYIDPVYVDTSRVCEQNDVYSFGILMLEVVCCEKPKLLGTRNSLIEKVWTCYQSNGILNAADQRLRGHFDIQITRVLMIGLSCVQPDRRLRPHIRRVMECLTNQTARLPSVSTSSYITVTLWENGPVSSTSDNCASTEDGYITCPTVLRTQPGIVEDATGTTPFLSGP
jgi:serine/threonine protein kinase